MNNNISDKDKSIKFQQLKEMEIIRWSRMTDIINDIENRFVNTNFIENKEADSEYLFFLINQFVQHNVKMSKLFAECIKNNHDLDNWERFALNIQIQENNLLDEIYAKRFSMKKVKNGFKALSEFTNYKSKYFKSHKLNEANKTIENPYLYEDNQEIQNSDQINNSQKNLPMEEKIEIIKILKEKNEKSSISNFIEAVDQLGAINSQTIERQALNI